MADDTVDTDEQPSLPASTIRAGTKLGAYRMLKQIGAGGMGAVWLAEHVMLGRQAAIKVLRRDAVDDEETVMRFFNEARAAAAIADPGIVQIFDFGHADDGSAYIVMELLKGEPLDERLKKSGRLPHADAMRIMRQVATSLAAAHAHGIIHRDLKPQNLFLAIDAEVPGGERAKILDFGIAKLTRDDAGISTDTHRFMGTPLYMAPEQCRDARAVDARSDVYALGCVLFLLVTGRPLFAAGNLAEMLTKQLYEEPPRARSVVPDLPPVVDELIARCVVKDPALRYQSASALVDAMVAATGSAPFAPAPVRRGSAVGDAAALAVATTLSRTSGEVTIQRAPRTRARMRWILAAAGVAAVAVAVTTALALSRTPERIDPPAPAAAVAPIVTPLPAPDAAVAEQPAVVAAPVETPTPGPADEVRSRIAALLHSFVRWAPKHRGDACPTAHQLARFAEVASLDPWSAVFDVTCTDQPADQILGIRSSGPDGTLGTADDIASWLLDPEVRSIAAGPRWRTKQRRKAERPVPSTTKLPTTGVPGDTDGDGIPDQKHVP